jgi:hypothetical protein
MRILWIALLSLAVLVAACATGWAQDSSQESTVLRLLLVDATKTFASTARVGALAGAIRSAGTFDLQVCFSDQEGTYGDPMIDVEPRPEGLFDLVVFVPRGIDDGTDDAIWVITNILPWPSPDTWGVVQLLSGWIDKVFTGLAIAILPTQDLFPALLASLYHAQGWLH